MGIQQLIRLFGLQRCLDHHLIFGVGIAIQHLQQLGDDVPRAVNIQQLAMRKEIREKYVTAYRDRIFYAADRIEKIPYLSLVRPKGTFYLFPGVEKTGLDEKAFCKVLLDQAHVLVSPGTPFGVSAAGHFRIACTVGIDRLKAAFDRMEKLSF